MKDTRSPYPLWYRLVERIDGMVLRRRRRRTERRIKRMTCYLP